MTRYFTFLFLIYLFPITASAFTVDNCDDKPHRVTVIFPGEVKEVDLPAGKSRYLMGVPSEVQVGTSRHVALRPNDTWCVWGDNKIALQRRIHSPGTGRR